MQIAAGITAAKAALDLTTKLADALNRPNIDPQDVKAKLHEMLIHLVNAQSALGEAHVEISELRQRLTDRAENAQIAADLEMHKGGYFTRQSESSKILYCSTCWGADKKLVPLIPYRNPGRVYCTIHKVDFTTPEYQPAPLRQSTSLEAVVVHGARYLIHALSLFWR